MNIEDDCCSHCFFSPSILGFQLHTHFGDGCRFLLSMRIVFLLAYSALGGFLHRALACRETNAEKDQIDGTTEGQERVDGMYLCSK